MKKIKIKFSPLSFSKRETFVLVTGILTLGLVGTQLISPSYRYLAVFVLGIAAYLLSAYALHEDLHGHEYITLLVLPTFFTLGISYFYFLLPVRWITRFPVAGLFALGYYAVLLTENIYNVSAGRTIQLIRAAQTVGFYLTLITCFLFMDLLFSLHLAFYLNGIIAFVVGILLYMPYFWSIKLTERIEKSAWDYSLLFGLMTAEIAVAISFWPLKTLTSALLLTSVFYVFLGIGGYELQERLFRRVVMEFISLPLFVFILILLTTSWTS